MKLDKNKLYNLIKEELKNILEGSGGVGETPMTIHPFDNHLANQPDVSSQENAYDELASAAIMEMMSVYNEDNVREIIRFLADRASQGPAGMGGRFTDEQLEEILLLVFEKVEEKIGVRLQSMMPQDREHPKYMDLG